MQSCLKKEKSVHYCRWKHSRPGRSTACHAHTIAALPFNLPHVYVLRNEGCLVCTAFVRGLRCHSSILPEWRSYIVRFIRRPEVCAHVRAVLRSVCGLAVRCSFRRLLQRDVDERYAVVHGTITIKRAAPLRIPCSCGAIFFAALVFSMPALVWRSGQGHRQQLQSDREVVRHRLFPKFE